MTEENHRILRKMQRAENVRVFMKIAQWVIILGLFAGLYYVIQPRLTEIELLFENYQTMFQRDNDFQLLQEYLDSAPSIPEGSLLDADSTAGEGVEEGE